MNNLRAIVRDLVNDYRVTQTRILDGTAAANGHNLTDEYDYADDCARKVLFLAPGRGAQRRVKKEMRMNIGTTYGMKELHRMAADTIKGRGHYCGHALHIGEHTSLVVYYVPKDPEAEIHGAHGFPTADRPGVFHTSMAI